MNWTTQPSSQGASCGTNTHKRFFGKCPPRHPLAGMGQRTEYWIFFYVFDHPRLTERGVKFLLRKVESFEEVSCRAGRGWMWERGEEGRPLLPAAGLGGPFSGS